MFFILSGRGSNETDYVRDANHTLEHWITDNFKVAKEDSYIIKIVDWNDTSEDIVPFYIMQIAEESYSGDYEEVYYEKYKENVPCMTIIEDIDFILDKTKETDISIDAIEIEETIKLKDFINSYYENNIYNIEISDDSINFTIKEKLI